MTATVPSMYSSILLSSVREMAATVMATAFYALFYMICGAFLANITMGIIRKKRQQLRKAFKDFDLQSQTHIF